MLLLLPRHMICSSAFCTMQFLLLVLIDQWSMVNCRVINATSRRSQNEFTTESGNDYIEAYSGHVTKASKHGTDYNDNYEYKESSEEFRSGTFDPEVGNI